MPAVTSSLRSPTAHGRRVTGLSVPTELCSRPYTAALTSQCWTCLLLRRGNSGRWPLPDHSTDLPLLRADHFCPFCCCAHQKWGGDTAPLYLPPPGSLLLRGRSARARRCPMRWAQANARAAIHEPAKGAWTLKPPCPLAPTPRPSPTAPLNRITDWTLPRGRADQNPGWVS